MKIGLTQFNIKWGDVDASMSSCLEYIKEAKTENADILCFPEFTLTGFVFKPQKYCTKETIEKILSFFKKASLEYDVALIFGYIDEGLDGAKPRNKLAIAYKGDIILDYAKIHSFSFGREHEFYSHGDEIFFTKIQDFNIGALICYDLRFPELFQISATTSDIIFVIANWPASRIDNWYTLLRARALETQCYIVGVNRIGSGGGIDYCHSSVAFDPAGVEVTQASKERILYFEASTDVIKKVREDFPLRKDRRMKLYTSLYSKYTH